MAAHWSTYHGCKTYKTTCLASLARLVFTFLLVSVSKYSFSSRGVEIPGHLQPLGSHQAPIGNIEEIDEFVGPDKFYEEFAKKSRAVVFKRACKDFKATKKWSDEFLRANYGDLILNVDLVKEENRHLSAQQMKLEDFLDAYSNNSWYMIDTLPRKMWGDFQLPLSLTCGGFLERIQDFVIWFSSLGSKSHLHMDTVENINCMISGSKKWFLVDLENSETVIFDQVEGDYSSVNVDKVDMLRYPFLRNLSWYNALVEEGDCIYVPSGWAHQVSSTAQRAIAVNLWWTPMTSFNHSDCEGKRPRSMDDVEFTRAEQYRYQLLQLLKSRQEPCNFVCIHSNVVSEHTGKKLISNEEFNVIDRNKNGLIESSEIHNLSLAELDGMFDGEEPGSVNVRGEFSASTSERKDEL